MNGQSALEVFQKAPPAVDEALRKRVSEFYQHHVDGTMRKAMQLVAEDSQDAFFNAQKSRMKMFEINEIRYGKDFQDATVMTLCEREVAVPLSGVQMMKMPVESSWKLVGGQWMWYIPKPTGCKETPFGCVPVDPAQEGKGGPSMSAKDLEAKVKQSMAAAQNLGDFGFKTRQVELVAGKTNTVELKFVNPLDGWVTLQMLNPFQDEELEVAPAPLQVKPMSEGVITFKLKKGSVAKARDVMVPFVIQPFFRQAPVRVVLKPR